MSVWPEFFSLEGNLVSLVPLSMEHHDDLVATMKSGELHRLWHTTSPETTDIACEIKRQLEARAEGSMLPFAIIDKEKNTAIGTTSYTNMDTRERRLEIGSTWYRRSAFRSPLSVECKLLLLGYAFETLDCTCVELRTHYANTQSRQAIEQLGARLEGMLRSTMPSGDTVRDTMVYSILLAEWTGVRNNLLWRLARARSEEMKPDRTLMAAKAN